MFRPWQVFLRQISNSVEVNWTVAAAGLFLLETQDAPGVLLEHERQSHAAFVVRLANLSFLETKIWPFRPEYCPS